MLLFADGFENFDVTDLDKKWSKYTTEWDENEFSVVKNNERKGNRCFQYNTSSDNMATNCFLTKNIKKSRTVFVGLAIKHVVGLEPVSIVFYSNTTIIATCNIKVGSSGSTTYKWTFPSAIGTDDIIIVMGDTSSSMGKFVYYELGITLNGNTVDQEDCTAWIENRSSVGQYHEKRSNIQTAIPGSDSSFFIDSVKLQILGEEYAKTFGLVDDFYICNDEGTFNNNFLGNIRIRSMTPSFYGSINNSEMVNFDASRHEGVLADFVNTIDPLPNPLPDPDQNPEFIPWSNPTTQYLRMNKEDDTQTFRMTHPNYGGANPKILGVVGTVLCRAQTDIGKRAKLQLARRKGYDVVAVSRKDAVLTPIKTGAWQGYSLIMENEEEELPGVESAQWKPTDVNESDWGFKLLENDTDPKEYLSGHLRLQQNHEETIFERFETQDHTHRFWDRLVDEILNWSAISKTGWAQFAFEAIGFGEDQTVVRRGLKGIDEQLYFKDEIPWQYFFLKEVMGLSDELLFAWAGDIFDSMGFTDDSIDKWVEEVADGYRVYGSNVRTDVGENIYDFFSLEEPLVWDNHETLEESLDTRVSYVWSAHELVEEYLWYQEYSIGSHGERVEEVIGFIEDHFDGWWVEELRDPLSVWFTGITQHWRYEWFMGVLINSIKILPIEDTGQWGGDGNDGDHTGLINWN